MPPRRQNFFEPFLSSINIKVEWVGFPQKPSERKSMGYLSSTLSFCAKVMLLDRKKVGFPRPTNIFSIRNGNLSTAYHKQASRYRQGYGSINILAGYYSHIDVIVIMMSSLLHRALPKPFCRGPPRINKNQVDPCSCHCRTVVCYLHDYEIQKQIYPAGQAQVGFF